MSKNILNEGYNRNNFLLSRGIGSKIFYNKKLIDLSFCAGSLLLGHNHKIYSKTILDLLKNKVSNFAAPNIYAEEYAKLLKQDFTNCSKIIFCNSGTEAIIKSLRIVKALNEKKKIINVVGSWHGSVDKLLFKPDKNLKPKYLSGGISGVDKKNLIYIPYNDVLNSKKILDKNKKNISCILVEPIQGSLPTYECRKYLKFLSNYCKKNNLILIFDEMITGLRTNGSTLQKFFKINADISTFGKCFGGGLPIGIISISKRIENQLKKKKKVFFGGTFSGNSISMFCGLKIYKYIKKNRAKIFKKINTNSKFFEVELNDFFLKNNLDLKIYRFESILRLVYTNQILKNRAQRDFFENKKNKKIQLFRKYILSNKIYYSSSGIIFFSLPTTIKEIKYVVKIFKKGALKYLK